ncbi:ATP-dependent DNA ligase [Pseudomonas oryzihabitans]|uniref:ATP-dependent DNA ligase n=1 Tax=Pseudomonas oryzihabitans TaxID=47885 RepID=UPI0015E2CB2A|nr:ATP-dependent DNA ligase [Pseudomonas psychrotolerans]MBA1211552.1 ATP-dependent DNA ligase [Pseudomonas psychrotolerans]
MAVQEVILETNPAGPVEYSQKAIEKVLAESYLIADTKEDGVQLNLVVELGSGQDWAASARPLFLSRAGKLLMALQNAYGASLGEQLNFTNLLKDERCLFANGFMVQAEIVTPGQPAEVTAGNLRRTRGKNLLKLEDVEVHVFAVVPLDVIRSGEDYGVTNAVMKYHAEAMVAMLQQHVPQIAWKMVESLDVFTTDQVNEVYEVRRNAGKEGLVLKDPNAIWKRGKKVGQWKMKPDDSIDGKVVGLVWGTPGLANEGKVIGFEVELEDGCVVNACGLTQEQKDEFTREVGISSDMDEEDFAKVSSGELTLSIYGNPYHLWAVTVNFMERFKDGSLRHPTFGRWRGISEPTVKE